MGKVRSVPLGVQTDPGLVGSVAGRPKNAPPPFRTGQVTRSLVQGRPEVRVKVSWWGRSKYMTLAIAKNPYL